MKTIASLIIVTSLVSLPLISSAQSTVSTSPTPTASTSTTATTKTDMPIRLRIVDTTITAHVVELDKADRMATFRTPNNDFVTVHIPASVKNFNQVKVGDEVQVHYTIAAAARILPANNDGIRELVESNSSKTAPAGGMPGVTGYTNVQVIANILAVDAKTRTVKLQGATRTVTITVPDDFDLSRLKVGDQVQAEFSDAVAIDIARTPASK